MLFTVNGADRTKAPVAERIARPTPERSNHVAIS